MSLAKYDNYKYSGVDWLGEIPEYWEVNNLKRLCSLIKDGTHGSFNRVDSGFPLLSVRNIVNSKFVLLEDDSMISKDDYLSIIKSFKIKENDIQLAIVGATMGKVAMVPKLPPFVTQRSVATIRTNSKLLFSIFLFYYAQSSKFQGFLWANTSYSAQPGIYLGTIQEIGTPLPSLPEQISIATYLDNKTSAFNRKVALLEQKITHYQQLRKSLINETVCRGLDKNVKLKDSEIDWIGMIPEHWEVKRFKSFAQTIKGKNLDFYDEYFEKSLPNLSLEYLRNDEVVFQTYCYSSSKSLLVGEDDYIIIWDGAGVGEILNGKKGFLSSTIAKIVVNPKLVYPKYLFHLRDKIEYTLKQIPAGMGIPHLNPFVLNNFPCPCPPLTEQITIATYLDKKIQKIDSIVSNIKTQIETLKELRKTLINDVVTGKIKVTQ
jgi:type I restriction enzyme S subunit